MPPCDRQPIYSLPQKPNSISSIFYTASCIETFQSCDKRSIYSLPRSQTRPAPFPILHCTLNTLPRDQTTSPGPDKHDHIYPSPFAETSAYHSSWEAQGDIPGAANDYNAALHDGYISFSLTPVCSSFLTLPSHSTSLTCLSSVVPLPKGVLRLPPR